jgi:hypothetical protein
MRPPCCARDDRHTCEGEVEPETGLLVGGLGAAAGAGNGEDARGEVLVELRRGSAQLRGKLLPGVSASLRCG